MSCQTTAYLLILDPLHLIVFKVNSTGKWYMVFSGFDRKLVLVPLKDGGNTVIPIESLLIIINISSSAPSGFYVDRSLDPYTQHNFTVATTTFDPTTQGFSDICSSNTMTASPNSLGTLQSKTPTLDTIIIVMVIIILLIAMAVLAKTFLRKRR